MTSGLQSKNSSNQNHPELSAFKALSTDEQLGLLWVLYEHMGESITPAAPGAAEAQFTQRLLEDVKAMEHSDQLAFMRDLVQKTATEKTKMYGGYTEDNKLLFWYQLAEEMAAGTVVPMPEGYELSSEAAKVFNNLAALDFNAQITVLRHAVLDMGAQ
ncbi:MAG: Orange carotenoid protein, N-terminal [Phormidesmis priestleyi Ana]|uniref:Orange carotenoid protein, N-terminal n=1 Tax=Phormidesmis priestleyi Ana TaxID=1666911 RepID=A0A0P8DGX1_9CYAN|nr:MAG: Orange carotenoid protein, N-terminal [Phormidesmis priestleyi Ana]